MKPRTCFQTDPSAISSTLESRIDRLCVSHSFIYRCTTSLAIVTIWLLRQLARWAVRKFPEEKATSAYQAAVRDVFPAGPRPRRDRWCRLQGRRWSGGAAASATAEKGGVATSRRFRGTLGSAGLPSRRSIRHRLAE